MPCLYGTIIFSCDCPMKQVHTKGGFKDDDYTPALSDYLRTRQERANENSAMTQTPAHITEIILECLRNPLPPLRLRASEWGENFCVLKTASDPDGTKATKPYPSCNAW
jgi:hypothetical protein